MKKTTTTKTKKGKNSKKGKYVTNAANDHVVNLGAVTTLQPVETLKELPPVTLHESLFWDTDDYRHNWVNGKRPYVMSGGEPECTQWLDMATDSYIWCFTGVRGAGKTTLMTYFAAKVYYLYSYRILSNYPIEFKLQRLHGKPEHVKAEPLDLYKLLCFDNEYRDCLILMDEAPDIISHMAAMTWKNRLLNIFVRQLRKNHNSLFLGAQDFSIIDKSMRWQTDILAECQDASRKYGWHARERGKCILLRLLDNSGMWTGETYIEAINKLRQEGYSEDARENISEDLEVFPRVLWGEKGKTKPVYDTYYQQDVWESLRRVDMRLNTYQVGDKKDAEPSELKWLQEAIPVVRHCMEAQSEEPESPGFQTKEFYSCVGALTTSDKDALSKRLNDCGVKIGQSGTGKRFYDFSEFDIERFAGT